MSLRPLASLVVKMLGLYAFINALPTVSTVLFSLFSSKLFGTGSPPVSPVLLAAFNASGGVLQTLVGAALWWFSDGVAQSAVKEDGDVPVRRDEALTTIGFSLVGVYLLAEFVISLSRYGTNLYIASRYVEIYRPENMQIGAQDLVPILARGAVALYLLLGARGLARGLGNLRNVGRAVED